MTIEKWFFVERGAKNIREPKLYSNMYLQFSEMSEDLKKNAKKTKGILIDLGAGVAPYEPYFKPYVDKYLKIDRFDYKDGDPNIIADASNLPLKNNSVDTILCTQVLEHVPEPKKIVDESFRVLKKGGIAIFTVPMASPIHGQPHDYFRFTKIALEKVIFKDFSKIEIEENGGALLSITQFIVWGIDEKLPNFIAKPLIIPINFIAKKLDRIFFNDLFTTNYIVVATK
jgi:SAM-dependent methyltransferase